MYGSDFEIWGCIKVVICIDWQSRQFIHIGSTPSLPTPMTQSKCSSVTLHMGWCSAKSLFMRFEIFERSHCQGQRQLQNRCLHVYNEEQLVTFTFWWKMYQRSSTSWACLAGLWSCHKCCIATDTCIVPTWIARNTRVFRPLHETPFQ